MNVEELRTVQRTERQKDSLQHLRDSFYRDVAEYIAERKAERERIASEVDDPFSSPEVSRLSDEIETAEEVVESIYERRIGKIVKRATFAAAGMAAEDEGLTGEERELFDDLVARIENNRRTVLTDLVGDVDADETAESDTPATETASEPATRPEPAAAGTAGGPAPTTPDPDDLLAEAMGGDGGEAAGGDAGETVDPASDDGAPAAAAAGAGPTPTPTAPDPKPESEPATTPGSGSGSGSGPDPDRTATDGQATDGGDAAASPGTDRTMLRITRDVGEIFGVDEREYDLASEDVVMLPTANAEPLLDRGAAERLE
jgi:DNA replication factor GINS